ncbi:hypothetical protein LTR82_001910 [Friedmanniomyces endolithicus]|uniref:PCI domain-containing protein n=1 Tax=Friedmanniomyces endolithicus TaxID=329885 RepID=A0AAN6JEF5_9PEZI|nr:hypothetical protein LTR82_001910 [Friedmanniomyces endolithicus]
MDQTRALNALAPYVALAKSANSSRAAADLVTQATSANNTYVFAELLQQPNVQALAGQEQYGAFHELLKVFAWGTWESYKATQGLPPLSDAQASKLRLLSLLAIAAQKPSTTAIETNLSYTALCARLDRESPIDLEHLVTQAIYNDLISATLNPAAQTVVITSVAPLRDLAPGSVADMIAELSAWSGRCDGVLADLEQEIAKVKWNAKRRHAREVKAEKQRAAAEGGEKSGTSGLSGILNESKGGRNLRGPAKKGEEDIEYEDAMELDGGSGTVGLGGGGKKRSAGGGGMSGALAGMMGKSSGNGGR